MTSLRLRILIPVIRVIVLSTTDANADAVAAVVGVSEAAERSLPSLHVEDGLHPILERDGGVKAQHQGCAVGFTSYLYAMLLCSTIAFRRERSNAGTGGIRAIRRLW